MRYLVEHIYGEDVRDTKQNAVIIEAELSDDAGFEEENRVFKPLILQKTGHGNIKIMSYKEVD